MKINSTVSLIILSLITFSSWAKVKENWKPQYQKTSSENISKKSIETSKDKKAELAKKNEKVSPLLKAYFKTYKDRKELIKLKKETLNLGGKAVPDLVKVIKNDKFPDKNRWMAMFLLGKIMGKKSSPYISRYLKHKNWVLRLASLKTLLALKAQEYSHLYSEKLKDKSMIVRTQALETIKQLKLSHLSPEVWKMMFRKHNYKTVKGKIERTDIIREVIKTIGELKYTKAKSRLLSMVQKEKYKDIFQEISDSLGHLTGKTPPKKDIESQKIYWSKFALREKKI